MEIDNPIDYLVSKFSEYDEYQIKLLHSEINTAREMYNELIEMFKTHERDTIYKLMMHLFEEDDGDFLDSQGLRVIRISEKDWSCCITLEDFINENKFKP